jgi:hypothetical protein
MRGGRADELAHIHGYGIYPLSRCQYRKSSLAALEAAGESTDLTQSFASDETQMLFPKRLGLLPHPLALSARKNWSWPETTGHKSEI